MNTYLAQLQAFWGRLAPDQRRNLVLAVGAATLAVAAVGTWSSQTPTSPLIENRTYEELLDAAAALDDAEVGYQIDDGVLRVPTSQLGKARSALAASEDMPGLADVSQLQLGLTPKAQDWAFLRAREGDLARMINGIDGVSASRVHIVPRKEALFVDEESSATASVFLKLRPGSALAAAQVRAVSNLVANAVEGLESEGVTIVDDRGNLLAEGRSDVSPADDAQEKLLAFREKLESRYNQAVTKALLPVLGWDGGFSVTSSVDLDATSSETVSKRVDADGQALLSEQLDESESQKAESGGVPGVDANLPERPAGQEGAQNRQQRSTTTANYTYPTVDEVVRRPAGELRRVSVAVQVDSARVEALATAGSTSTEELQQRIDEAVKAAVGFDAQRGDLVSVHVLPFAERDWVEGTTPAASVPAEAMAALPYAVSALALVLVFFFVVRPLMSRLEPSPALAASLDGVGGGEGGEGNVVSLEEKRPLANRLADLMDGPTPIGSDQLSELVDEQPAAAAKVLRLWNRESAG
jgi:flagellar M-ring protein FliF